MTRATYWKIKSPLLAERAMMRNFSLSAVAADAKTKRVVVERQRTAVHRSGCRGAEVFQINQVLQVIGEAVERVSEVAVVGEAFLRITNFEDAALNRVTVGVNHERIVQPFAGFVGKCRNVLREDARRTNVGEVRIRLRRRSAAKRAVVTADAASTFSQIHVVGDEDREGVGSDLRAQLGHDRLDLSVEPVDVGQTDLHSELVTHAAVGRGHADSLQGSHTRLPEQYVVTGLRG